MQPNHSSGKSELAAFLTLLTALWSLLDPARTMDRTETGALEVFLSVSLLFKEHFMRLLYEILSVFHSQIFNY